jgi:hypothetical protein
LQSTVTPMKAFIPILLVLPLFLISCSDKKVERGEESLDVISQSFMDPPNSARTGAFWCWLNGNMTLESITRDLEAMKDKGMSRAEIWDVAAARNPDNMIPAGGSFLGDSSVALIKHALREGERLGMKIGMIGSSGWNAGGPWVKPDWASKALYFSKLLVKGPSNGGLELPFPEVPEHCPKGKDGLPQYYGEVAVLAFPFFQDKIIGDPEGIIDLTNQFSDGLLSGQLPAGEWVVMRFIFTNSGQTLIVPSPNSKGLFIDFLDPKATTMHLQHIMERVGMVPGDSTEGGLSYLEFDSMELDEGVPWTDSMPGIFQEMRGYDLIKYLPVLAGWKLGDKTDQFNYDWKKTISDQLIFSHYTTGRRVLETYGVQLVAEAGGPGPPIWNTCPVDALKALGNVSIPREPAS